MNTQTTNTIIEILIPTLTWAMCGLVYYVNATRVDPMNPPPIPTAKEKEKKMATTREYLRIFGIYFLFGPISWVMIVIENVIVPTVTAVTAYLKPRMVDPIDQLDKELTGK